MKIFTSQYSQQEILKYRGGHLGITTVPGAGKPYIFAALAAQNTHSGALIGDESETGDMESGKVK